MASSTESTTTSQKHLHPYHDLSVSELEVNDATCEKIEQITQEWETIAKDNAKQKDHESTFLSLFSLAGTMHFYMVLRKHDPKKFQKDWGKSKIFVCEDTRFLDHEIQAIAFVDMLEKENFVKISLLTTNPHNVRSELNKKNIRHVNGAGSAIIYYLANAFRQRIELLADNDAVEFYKKCGFEEGQKYELSKHTEMHLSVEKIQRLFQTA
jgi:hypothetical protein